MNNYYLEKSLVVPSQGSEIKVARCCKCKQFFLIPTLPFCPECQNYMDNCQHGLACTDCSWKIIWSEITLGHLRIDALTSLQIQEIQKSILQKFQQEVYVDKNNCLQVKSRT